jgi:hypothetical protein
MEVEVSNMSSSGKKKDSIGVGSISLNQAIKQLNQSNDIIIDLIYKSNKGEEKKGQVLMRGRLDPIPDKSTTDVNNKSLNNVNGNNNTNNAMNEANANSLSTNNTSGNKNNDTVVPNNSLSSDSKLSNTNIPATITQVTDTNIANNKANESKLGATPVDVKLSNKLKLTLDNLKVRDLVDLGSKGFLGVGKDLQDPQLHIKIGETIFDTDRYNIYGIYAVNL